MSIILPSSIYTCLSCERLRHAVTNPSTHWFRWSWTSHQLHHTADTYRRTNSHSQISTYTSKPVDSNLEPRCLWPPDKCMSTIHFPFSSVLVSINSANIRLFSSKCSSMFTSLSLTLSVCLHTGGAQWVFRAFSLSATSKQRWWGAVKQKQCKNKMC